MKRLILPVLISIVSIVFAVDYQIQGGSTDVTFQIPLYDATTGALKTSVTITNLDLYYIRVETDEDVTLSSKTDFTALAALTDDHSDGQAYEIGYGYYRFDFPDAIFATGATTCSIYIEDGTSSTILPATLDIQLIDYDPYDLKGDMNDLFRQYKLHLLAAEAMDDANYPAYDIAEESILSELMSGGDANEWDYETDTLKDIYDKQSVGSWL